MIAWSDDVEVVEFDGLGAIVIGNRGDGPVYVWDVRADTGPFAFVRLINSVIEPGDLGFFEPDPIFESVRFRYITPNKETRHAYEDTLTVPAVAGLDLECLEGRGAS